MKKILFVVEAMGGGVFTYIVELANELVNFMIYILHMLQEHKHLKTIKIILIREST